jgi:hypothetical protein
VSTSNTGIRPDVTLAQKLASLIVGIPIICKLLSVFDIVTLTLIQQEALADTVQWAGIFAGILVVSDTGLRAARNSHDAKVTTAAMHPTAGTGTPPLDHGARAIPSDEDPLPSAGGPLPTDEQEFGGAVQESQEFPPGKR